MIITNCIIVSVYILLLLYLLLLYGIINMFCISLVIPSDEESFLRCYNNLNVNYRSFSLAKEIIIVISSVTNEAVIYNSIKNFKNKNKIKFAIRKDFHNAASNKNYGFKMSRCQIVSFFDIDDIMSNQRLLILYNLFEQDRTTEFALHKYTKSCKHLNNNKSNIKIVKYKYKVGYREIQNVYKKHKNSIDYCCKYVSSLEREPISNGWVTIRRYIFKKYKFNESYNFGEDSLFNYNLILYGFNLSVLNISLGYYIKDNKCINFCIT